MTTKSAIVRKAVGKSLQTFRDQHDRSVIIPKKLNAGLEALVDEHGQPGWEYEVEFLRLCQLRAQDVTPFREQFAAHIVVVRSAHRHPTHIWAKTPALAAKLRQMVL